MKEEGSNLSSKPQLFPHKLSLTTMYVTILGFPGELCMGCAV